MAEEVTVRIEVTINDIRHQGEITNQPSAPDATHGTDEDVMGRQLQIIDFRLKGNVVRLFLGTEDVRAWGDDWDDVPYEHNAGPVYKEHVAAAVDIAFDFDAYVCEPCDGEFNSPWSKRDMQLRKVPCLATLMLDEGQRDDGTYDESFENVVTHQNATRVFLGDVMAYGREPKWLPPYATILAWRPTSHPEKTPDEG